MHFLFPILIITLLITLVSSHQNTSAVPTGPDLSGLPRCAAACAVTAFAGMTGCRSDDYPCMCRDQKFTDTIGVCIGKSCTGEELEKATNFAKGICGPDVPTGTPVNGVRGSGNTTIAPSTTAHSATSTITVAKATTTTRTRNSGDGIRPSGFALGAGLLALFAL
ncbi:hypothetical protein HOY82DRAFT_596721 [Tuber indicum]|nr:hypothetical protein HOY82DRAFT_596721 [Tuber indicum]